MDRERLIALHTLSVLTVIGGFLSLFSNWLLVMTVMPLHVYFAVHGARAAGAGRIASLHVVDDHGDDGDDDSQGEDFDEGDDD